MIAPLRTPGPARAWFLLTAVLALLAVAAQVWLSATGDDGFFDAPVYRALNLFVYFTIQSNLLVALSALLTVLDPDRDTLFRRVLQLTALVAITVTGVVYHLVLAGFQELSGLAWLADQTLHTVVPVLTVLGWVLFGPRARTSWRVVWLSLLFPSAWLVLTLVRGPLVGGFWPYPFVDVAEIGLVQALLNSAVVAVFFVALAAAAHGLDGPLRRIARTPARR